MRHFDLCIIGTGSGNSIIDERFDHLSVALVEMGTFGGTCLNVGCIPSKMFVYPADLAASTIQASISRAATVIRATSRNSTSDSIHCDSHGIARPRRSQ